MSDIIPGGNYKFDRLGLSRMAERMYDRLKPHLPENVTREQFTEELSTVEGMGGFIVAMLQQAAGAVELRTTGTPESGYRYHEMEPLGCRRIIWPNGMHIRLAESGFVTGFDMLINARNRQDGYRKKKPAGATKRGGNTNFHMIAERHVDTLIDALVASAPTGKYLMPDSWEKLGAPKESFGPVRSGTLLSYYNDNSDALKASFCEGLGVVSAEDKSFMEVFAAAITCMSDRASYIGRNGNNNTLNFKIEEFLEKLRPSYDIAKKTNELIHAQYGNSGNRMNGHSRSHFKVFCDKLSRFKANRQEGFVEFLNLSKCVNTLKEPHVYALGAMFREVIQNECWQKENPRCTYNAVTEELMQKGLITGLANLNGMQTPVAMKEAPPADSVTATAVSQSSVPLEPVAETSNTYLIDPTSVIAPANSPVVRRFNELRVGRGIAATEGKDYHFLNGLGEGEGKKRGLYLVLTPRDEVLGEQLADAAKTLQRSCDRNL